MSQSSHRPSGIHQSIAVPTVDVTTDGLMDRSYPDITFRFANGVSLTPSIQYATPPSSRPLTLDLYQPSRERPDTADRALPILIFVHGGSWARGDARSSRPLKNFPEVLAAIAANGFVVASIDYRLVGEALWPAQGQDVAAAVRYLRKNASSFGADPSRIAGWGVSCGAHLVAAVATSHRQTFMASPDLALADTDASIQAALCWYGGYDMQTIEQHCEEAGAYSRKDPKMPEWQLLGGHGSTLNPEFVRSAGPVNFVDANTPPMLLVTGQDDILIPALQTQQMAARLAEVGIAHELLVMPGVGHDLAGKTGEETRAANQMALGKSLTFLSRVFSESNIPQ